MCDATIHKGWMRQEDLQLPCVSQCNGAAVTVFQHVCAVQGVLLQYECNSAIFLKQLWQLSSVP